MSLTVYGIRQCDSCRKALRWLTDQGIEHNFHDLRADGFERDLAERWLASDRSGQLVNRRSATWRGLTEAQRGARGAALVDLLLTHPTLVKRPVFDDGDFIAVGFTGDLRARLQTHV